MNIRGIGDVQAPSRLLWLVVGTVVLPALLLSWVGYTALEDQREARAAAANIESQRRLAFAEGALAALQGQALGGAADWEEKINLALSRRFGDGTQVRIDYDPSSGPHLELSLVDAPPDPLSDALVWTSRLAPWGLAGLAGLVLLGAVLTLRSALREIRLSQLQADFVSNVSHELRTPMTSIQLFVETLQSGRLHDPARIQECLDLLAQETDRLGRMIERVLDWARLEAGKRLYSFESVGIPELVEAALRAFRSQTLHAAVPPVSLELAQDLPPVRADRDAMVEALVNLLQNAARHGRGLTRITVGAIENGRYLELWVEDDGQGIAPRHQKRVFEKFYQIDTRLSAGSASRRGSGLGLAIVRAILRAHGGSVLLQSTLGRGSRFTLKLPRAT